MVYEVVFEFRTVLRYAQLVDGDISQGIEQPPPIELVRVLFRPRFCWWQPATWSRRWHAAEVSGRPVRAVMLSEPGEPSRELLGPSS